MNVENSYIEVYSCDVCECPLGEDDEWLTCEECSEGYYKTFDVCKSCSGSPDYEHEHSFDSLKETSMMIDTLINFLSLIFFY